MSKLTDEPPAAVMIREINSTDMFVDKAVPTLPKAAIKSDMM